MLLYATLSSVRLGARRPMSVGRWARPLHASKKKGCERERNMCGSVCVCVCAEGRQ